MRYEEVPEELKDLAYDFFFWFSRFEAALKEGRYLRRTDPGDPAEAGWDRFQNRWRETYVSGEAAAKLMDANPKKQVVGLTDLEFRELSFDGDAGDIDRAVRLVKTVRNNVFHGGKHGADHWDDPERTKLLLGLTIHVLHDMAEQCQLADYRRYY